MYGHGRSCLYSWRGTARQTWSPAQQYFPYYNNGEDLLRLAGLQLAIFQNIHLKLANWNDSWRSSNYFLSIDFLPIAMVFRPTNVFKVPPIYGRKTLKFNLSKFEINVRLFVNLPKISSVIFYESDLVTLCHTILVQKQQRSEAIRINFEIKQGTQTFSFPCLSPKHFKGFCLIWMFPNFDTMERRNIIMEVRAITFYFRF